jgi:DNA-binding transcriptional MerR regulator
VAAQRPENAEERLVAEALQRAFGAPVPAAAFLAGRDAVAAAASLAAAQADADDALVTAALTGAFAVPVAAEVRAEHVAAIRAAAEAPTADNVVPLRRFAQQVGRHAVAAVVAVSTMAGGTGVAAASTDALPGQMLYPVKRAVEQVMLTAAWTPSAEARVQTRLAARRLAEAERLLAGGLSLELVEPLLSEYDQHVAVIEELAVSGTTVQLAVLEEKAEELREQTSTVAVADDMDGDAVTTAEPTETSPPVVTTTEPPAAGATESTTATEPEPTDPAPAPSASTRPVSTSSGSSGGSGGSTGGSTQPAPTANPSPTPSPTPTPSPSPSPTRPPQTGVDDAKNPAPGQAEPEAQKPEPEKPKPTPTVNPERTPLSDNAPLYDAGPLDDSEERSYWLDEG